MSSTNAPAINYAKYMGFESVPAAIVFGVLYLVLFAFFIGTCIKHKTSVYYSLAFFCARASYFHFTITDKRFTSFTVRIIAFAIRAVLAGSESAAEISAFSPLMKFFSALASLVWFIPLTHLSSICKLYMTAIDA